MGLALQAVHNIAVRASDSTVQALDTGLVLECAREASDASVRNAALALVAVLAGKQPDNTLKHVLEVSSLAKHYFCPAASHTHCLTPIHDQIALGCFC